MSIATEKEKLATERFLLIRMNPARYILPVLNAGLYEITLPFTINRLERNGVPLTKVSGTPASNDEWNQNETTGLVQVMLASAPNDTSNVLVVFYYLFYTGTIGRVIGEDPETPNTNLREWQPLIQNYPSIFQSIDNIFAGVFTINDTDIVLINQDKQLQNFMTDEDSFFNKEVNIWMCISDVSNIQKIFNGVVKKIVFNQNNVVITCVDVFNKFKSKATMGDSVDEIYYSASGFPDVDDKGRDKPVPYVVGKSSRYTTTLVRSFAGTPDQYYFTDGNEAICISKEAVSNTTNRTWGACRQKGDVQIQTYGTIDDVVNFAATDHAIKFSSYSNVRVGDTFRFNDGSDQYGIVTHVGAFTYLGNPYDIIVTDPTAGINNTVTILATPSFALSIFDPVDNESSVIRYGRDYTISSSTTSGGNKFIEIVFVNNFESVFAFGDLDPAKHKVSYRTSNDEAETHAQIIQDICDVVGVPTDTTSFTQADLDLDAFAQFSIPYFDETDYDMYLKYIQDLLASTLGFLKINSDFELEYNLLATPTSTDVRDVFLTLADTTQANVEYQDIITQIISYNPHNSSFQATSVSPSPSETRDNMKAKHLHTVENIVRFRHLLETITDRIDAHISFKSERSVRYKFATATQDIDSEINTDLQFENGIILGTSKVKDVKIISIDKSPKLTTIEATDLKGI